MEAITYRSAMLRILGGSADYSIPEALIDDSFCTYQVIGEFRPKPAPSMWGYLKWWLSPVYHAELIIDGPPTQRTLEECRELIYQAIELDPEHFEASRPIEEWKNDLWAAVSFEELFLVITCSLESNARFDELRRSREGSGRSAY